MTPQSPPAPSLRTAWEGEQEEINGNTMGKTENGRWGESVRRTSQNMTMMISEGDGGKDGGGKTD